ncbi:hypothetical protein [Burkholderia sp. 22PA0106]|uniref:hypothetical protein n=1 Tax=Burkholderia sp. 22PA0106 TaxID=3237371 RepID=UPI0039C3D501
MGQNSLAGIVIDKEGEKVFLTFYAIATHRYAKQPVRKFPRKHIDQLMRVESNGALLSSPDAGGDWSDIVLEATHVVEVLACHDRVPEFRMPITARTSSKMAIRPTTASGVPGLSDLGKSKQTLFWSMK